MPEEGAPDVALEGEQLKQALARARARREGQVHRVPVELPQVTRHSVPVALPQVLVRRVAV